MRRADRDRLELDEAVPRHHARQAHDSTADLGDPDALGARPCQVGVEVTARSLRRRDARVGLKLAMPLRQLSPERAAGGTVARPKVRISSPRTRL
jgi:hypothetical protein